DSIVIQIPYLEGHRRNDLEQLLALFDQSYRTSDRHFLHFEEEELPERYRPLLRRLQKVAVDPVIRQTMDAEDDLLEELQGLQRLISRKEQLVEAKDKVIQFKDKVIERAIRTMFNA